MYPASDWSALSSRPSWISARVRSRYRTGLERAVGVTSVRMRREDRSSMSSHPLADLWRVTALARSSIVSVLRAVPLFVPGGRSFVPACDPLTRRAQGPSRLAVALVLPHSPALPGQALTGPSTARTSGRSGRCRIGLDALESAPLVKNRPGAAGQLVGERNRQHVVMQAFFGGLDP